MTVPFQVPDFGKALRDTMIVAGQQRVQEVVKEQPWYVKYSNTAATVVSAITAFSVWAGGNEIGLPNSVQLLIGGILVVAQTLGIKATKNGLTEGTANKAMDPYVMDAVAAEAEKLITAQLEAAFNAQPPEIHAGEHRA